MPSISMSSLPKAANPGSLPSGRRRMCCRSWSPDGSLIAFCRQVPGQTGYDSRSRVPFGVYVVPPNGGAERYVGPGWGGVSWSVDGRKLVVGGGTQDSGGLDLLDVDSSHRTSLTSRGVDYLPAFSPDGKWVAFKREVAGSAQEVFVMPASEGGQARQLTSDVSARSWAFLDCGQPRNRLRFLAEAHRRQSLASFRFRRPAGCRLGLRSVSYPNVARQGRLLAFNEAWTDSNVHVWTGTGIPRSGTSWHFGGAHRDDQFHSRRSQPRDIPQRRTYRLRLGSHRKRRDLGVCGPMAPSPSK